MSNDDDKPHDAFAEALGKFMSGDGPPPTEMEPSKDMLDLGRNLREQYTAFRRSGFDDRQAFGLVCTALSALLGRSPGN